MQREKQIVKLIYYFQIQDPKAFTNTNSMINYRTPLIDSLAKYLYSTLKQCVDDQFDYVSRYSEWLYYC